MAEKRNKGRITYEELEQRIRKLEARQNDGGSRAYMCLTEYNETETMELLRQEGRQEGCRETRLLDIRNLMDCTGWTAEKAMELLKIPKSQRAALHALLLENPGLPDA